MLFDFLLPVFVRIVKSVFDGNTRYLSECIQISINRHAVDRSPKSHTCIDFAYKGFYRHWFSTGNIVPFFQCWLYSFTNLNLFGKFVGNHRHSDDSHQRQSVICYLSAENRTNAVTWRSKNLLRTSLGSVNDLLTLILSVFTNRLAKRYYCINTTLPQSSTAAPLATHFQHPSITWH